jgi:hypothetical protein
VQEQTTKTHPRFQSNHLRKIYSNRLFFTSTFFFIVFGIISIIEYNFVSTWWDLFPAFSLAIEGGVELTFINVLSPIEIGTEFPDDYMDYLSGTIDGKSVGKDIIEKVEITYEGKKFAITDSEAIQGKLIKVGGTLQIFIPGINVKAGEEHEFSIAIKEDTRFTFTVKRIVQ